ncbi:hypothetical protein LMG24076_03285 [Trinickia soli]|nr:hypothetical protein LMG24076_03285 [Trinickia soli]
MTQSASVVSVHGVRSGVSARVWDAACALTRVTVFHSATAVSQNAT